MAWERRGRSFYYYKKERHGSIVRSVYVGRGEIACTISQTEIRSTLLRGRAPTIKSQQTVIEKRAETAINEANNLINMVMQASLISAGFHMHHRQWRRSRSMNDNEP